MGAQLQILCPCYDAKIVPVSTSLLGLQGEDIYRVIIHNYIIISLAGAVMQHFYFP